MPSVFYSERAVELAIRCVKPTLGRKKPFVPHGKYSRMTQLLTLIMTRAVPNIQVDSVTLIKGVGDLYWFLVAPSHYAYWDWFERTYPHWEQVAYKYGLTILTVDEIRWPAFPTQKALVGWLSDTLKLTQGECKLLLLDVGLWDGLSF
ncbi:MAG: hypothetical protein DRH15_02980 [Deltaproteobacteria bacterium]|nr:MAG: hypothetical protein DRH15_02980 [Deltaproteobacteria bacterium]